LAAALTIAALPALAQQDDVPILRPKSPITKPASATLLVICDLACNWKLDGEAKGRIEAGGSAKAKVEQGQHVVVALTEDAVDKTENNIEIKTTGQTIVRIELQPIRDARLKAAQDAKDKADREARDKAAQDAKDKADREARDKAAQDAKDKADRDARDKAAQQVRDKAAREMQERKQEEQATTANAARLIGTNPATRARGAIVSAESIEALRTMNAVRPLQPLEDDQFISSLPSGVYGFTVPWIINTNSSGIVGGTGINKLGLNRSSRGTAVMEIHKLYSGDIYVVGYLSESDLALLQNSSRTSDAKATLFFSPYHEFSVAVAIPLSHIKTSRNRRIENFYANDISVSKLNAHGPK